MKSGVFTLNGKEIVVKKGETLESLSLKINKHSNANGIKAKIVEKDNGYKLQLISKNKTLVTVYSSELDKRFEIESELVSLFLKGREIKQYRTKITEEQLLNDDYFQSIKTEYNVLQLFGLTNVELFTILVDNSIKKNTYQIEWFKITPFNIKNDKIKFNGIIHPSLELSLSFTLDFLTYF
jgi:nanoRNase/pAp phosphatase (c-di-AMP/oligoRNAs hydrolase)